MSLGVNGINQNIFSAPAAIVSGTELTKAAQNILSSTSSMSAATSSLLSGVNFGSSVDVSLYGFNESTNTNAVKLAATNTAGYDLSLSNQALSAINSLNAKAASDIVNNIAQFRNGLIHIDKGQTDFSGLKKASAPPTSTEVFQSMNLGKDRQGSGPFYVPQNNGKKAEKKDGLDLVA